MQKLTATNKPALHGVRIVPQSFYPLFHQSSPSRTAVCDLFSAAHRGDKQGEKSITVKKAKNQILWRVRNISY